MLQQRIEDMAITLFFIFLFCCFIPSALTLPVSINYTLLSTNLEWNYGMGSLYPVLVNNHTVLANGYYSLSFQRVAPTKNKFALGIFKSIGKAEPQMIWDTRKTVSENSRLELDSGGALVLRDELGNVAWSLGQDVNSLELNPDGNLILYDASGAALWQSINHPTDTLLMGQNFTSLTAGDAIAVFTEGILMVNKSSTQALCRIPAEGGLKAQLNFGEFSTSFWLVLHCYNSTDFLVQEILVDGNEGLTENSFIRLHQDGYFMLYRFNKEGEWNWVPICCSDPNVYGFYTCYQPTEVGIWAAYTIICLVLFIFCLQLLWTFMKTTRLRSLLYIIIICSIFATSLVLAKLRTMMYYNHFTYYVYNSVYDYNRYYMLLLETITFAIELISLQTTTIILLKLLVRSPSPKIIATLIVLHMLATLCSYTTIVAQFWSTGILYDILDMDASTRPNVIWMLPFSVYPLPVVNTILLIIAKLPGYRYCNRNGQIYSTIFVNLFTAVASSCLNLLWVRGDKQHLSLLPLGTILNLLTLVLILISVWAYYKHHSKYILAKMQSLKLSIQRTLLWLLILIGGHSDPVEISVPMSLCNFKYAELEVLTNNFSKLLGKGGFGGVYEGVLLDGKKVAVKRLESSTQGMQEFMTEIQTLGKIHHVNLVDLLGFCAEGSYKLLVYEFMSRGSLEKWIFEDGTILDWSKRMKIILETARGLAYLHQECEPRILHLDVKPQNILLDESFQAKVSDFGLCRLKPGDQTSLLITKIMGTFGYLAPETLSSGSVSERNDVYSFGIVMLEVISGRRAVNSPNFPDWAMENKEGNAIIDPRLLLQEGYNEKEGKMMIEVALTCTAQEPSMRPSMKTVVTMLEGLSNNALCLSFL